MQTQRSIVVALAVAMCVCRAHADTYVWDGGGTDNRLSTAKNWVGDAVVMGTHDYVFGDASLRATVDSSNGGNNRDIGKYVLTGNGFNFIHTGNSLRLMAVTNVSLDVSTSGTNIFSMATLVLKDKLIGTGTGRVVFNAYVSFESGGPLIDCPATLVLQATNGNGSGANRTFIITNTPTVLVYNTNNSALGSARINLNGGTLGGSGIVAPGDASNTNNGVRVAAGAQLAPGGDGVSGRDVVGTLRFNLYPTASLYLAPGARLAFDLTGATNSDRIIVTGGNLGLSGQQFADFTFNARSGFGAGTYTLIESANTTGTLGSALSGSIAGQKAAIRLAGNNIVLDVKPSGTVVMCR